MRAPPCRVVPRLGSQRARLCGEEAQVAAAGLGVLDIWLLYGNNSTSVLDIRVGFAQLGYAVGRFDGRRGAANAYVSKQGRCWPRSARRRPSGLPTGGVEEGREGRRGAAVLLQHEQQADFVGGAKRRIRTFLKRYSTFIRSTREVY